MKAALLVAGLGKRFYPLSHNRSKHMIPVAGKPLLEHSITELKEAGVDHVILIVGYKKEVLQDYFQDGRKWGISIEYVDQDFSKGRGTGIAAGFAREKVGDNPFLLIYGDLQYDSETIKGMITEFEKEQIDALLSLIEIEDPSLYGVVELDENGYATRIVEKPKPGESESKMTNAGIYLFSPEIFKAIDKTGLSPRGEIELTDSIQILVNEGKKVKGYDIKKGWWRDIGRAYDLLDANAHYFTKIQKMIKGTLEPNTHIKGDVYVGENTIIRSGTYIEGPVYIGDNSDIGPNAYIRPNTYIGNNCRIGNACEVKASIIMSNTKISHLSYVGDSIIGDNVNFGAATIAANLRLDHKAISVKENGQMISTGRRKLGVICGDNVNVGCNVNLEPGVRIGANSTIGPNIVVSEDVEPDTKIFIKWADQNIVTEKKSDEKE
ncbi:MAG: bifunctional sugar-1-phosphate nucleotidylyltransferase/acetyltransferase [Candidatus Hodarchaeota archaeon]